MKRANFLVTALVLAVALAGCGGDSVVVSPTVSVVITGAVQSDGYIENNAGTYTAFQLDGIRIQSPLGPSLERRGFASFPISLLPVGALVDSARVKLYVNYILQDSPGTPVSLDVYHVYYGSTLLDSDFLAPRIFVTTFTLWDTDTGDLPAFDLSPELQLDVDDSTHGFFQLMLIARNGVVEIEDSENSLGTGFLPELDVTYIP